MMHLRISTRLWLMAGLSFALFSVAIAIGLYGMKTAERSLKSVYEDRAVPIQTLAELDSILHANQADVFRSFLHDPARAPGGHINHPVEVHLDAIARRVVVGDRLWQTYMATVLAPRERGLADDFLSKREAWLRQMEIALAAVRAARYEQQTLVDFGRRGNDSFDGAIQALSSLRSYQVDEAGREYTAARQRFQRSLWLFAILAVCGFAGLLLAATLTLRRINGGLREAGLAAEAIAGGNFAVALPMPTQVQRDELDALMLHVDSLRCGMLERVGELRSNEARSRAMLHTMRDGLVQIDSHGTILLVNGVICELFGYDEEELIGRNVRLLMPEPYRSAHDGYLERYLTTREARIVGLKRREVEGLRKDGSQFAMDLSVNEMVDDAGSTFIGVIRDITEQKAAQQKLEAALETAQSAVAVKGRFLANMSHEIRTPINAVLGFSDLCLRLDLSARARDYVGKTHSAAKSLLGIVNDILDFSKLEAGKVAIENVPFSLGDVLHDIASLFSLKAREKGIELAIGALPEVPDRLQGDPLRLMQVLTNLTGNALKFTERGEIDLTVECLAATATGATLRFRVRDSGVGLSAEQLARLFNPFAQADSSTTRKYGGTGLGLAISKQLVERMGGAIEVSSEPGEGSTFGFTLTLPLATDVAVPLPVRSPLANKQVLIVDDSSVMRTLLARSVEAFGCGAVAVGTAAELRATLQQETRFDLILLDWRLPDQDGIALAHQLRADGHAMPIVMVTGDELAGAREIDLAHDIQAFLAKPVSRSSLHNTLVDVLGGHAVLPPLFVGAQQATPDLSGKRILLVDDNEFNRLVGCELVGLTGATVETANDGAESVAAVAAGHYDLVLMDLQMPVMDGYTAARQIRTQWPDLPVLALTAHAMSEERARVLAAGMNDILTKPILPEALFALLLRWLPTAAVSAPVQPQTQTQTQPVPVPVPQPVPAVETPLAVSPAPTFSPAPEAEPGVSPAPAGFDMAMALSRVGGNRSMLERFLQLFRDRNAGALTEIATALQAQDWPTARRLAHTLKGGAGTVGLIALQAAAARLESDLAAIVRDDAPADHTTLREAHAQLETAWAQAQTVLASLLDSHASTNTTGDLA